jgi:chromosome segregation ATPase
MLHRTIPRAYSCSKLFPKAKNLMVEKISLLCKNRKSVWLLTMNMNMQVCVTEAKYACRYLFELFHIEKQLQVCADEADGHAGRLTEAEKDCRAVTKVVDKQTKMKAEKQKEWAAADRRVEELEKNIKSIQQKNVFKLDSELRSRKSDLEKLSKDIETAQKSVKETKKAADEDQRNHDALAEELEAEREKGIHKDIKLKGEQVSKYLKLKQAAKAAAFTASQELDSAHMERQNLERALTTESNELDRLINKKKLAENKLTDCKAMKEQQAKKAEVIVLRMLLHTCKLFWCVYAMKLTS